MERNNLFRLMSLVMVSADIRERLLTDPEMLVEKPIIYGSERICLNDCEKSLVASIKDASTAEEFASKLYKLL